jgi:hypothetical protein
MSEERNELLNIVLRQTTLSEEEALALLEKHEYDHIKAIEEFMGIKRVNKETKLSVNQQIYREIRTLMGTTDAKIA